MSCYDLSVSLLECSPDITLKITTNKINSDSWLIKQFATQSKSDILKSINILRLALWYGFMEELCGKKLGESVTAGGPQ